MANIPALFENFANAVVGDDVTTLNTIFTKVTGTPPVVVADPYDSTQRMMRVAPPDFTSIGELTFTAVPLLWFRFDLDVVAPLDTNTAILNAFPTAEAVLADKIGDVRLVAGTRTIHLRNVNTVAWTSAPLAAGQKHRIYVMLKLGATPADRRLRVQVVSGGDLTGSVTQDSGEIVATTTAATVGHLRMGSISTASGTVRFGRLRGDDAAAPYPVVSVPNVAPEAAFTSTMPLTVAVDATSSTDPDGTVASYSWDWGDGQTTVGGAKTEHVYSTAGTYTIALTVTDDDGATATTARTVMVPTSVSGGPSNLFLQTESDGIVPLTLA